MRKSGLLRIILVFSTATMPIIGAPLPGFADEASISANAAPATPSVAIPQAMPTVSAKKNREHHGYVSVDEVSPQTPGPVDPANLSAALANINPKAQDAYDAISNSNDLALIQMPSACPSLMIMESTSAVGLNATSDALEPATDSASIQ